MLSEWSDLDPDLRAAVTREALTQARHVIGAQAQLLAEQMERGGLCMLEGPDALRLLAMLLEEETADA